MTGIEWIPLTLIVVGSILLVYTAGNVLRNIQADIGYLHSTAAKVDQAAAGQQVAARQAVPASFETEALANYYNHALSRANIAFYFSLAFATLGFLVILVALFLQPGSDVGGTAAKVAGGVVTEAVAALFFVQSTAAQKSMQAFFEKLRLDRAKADAQQLIDAIEDSEKRDALRVELARKFVSIEASLPTP